MTGATPIATQKPPRSIHREHMRPYTEKASTLIARAGRLTKTSQTTPGLARQGQPVPLADQIGRMIPTPLSRRDGPALRIYGGNQVSNDDEFVPSREWFVSRQLSGNDEGSRIAGFAIRAYDAAIASQHALRAALDELQAVVNEFARHNLRDSEWGECQICYAPDGHEPDCAHVKAKAIRAKALAALNQRAVDTEGK